MTGHSFTLSIEGMHCGGCVRRVTKALEGIEGVTLEHVEVGQARGFLDPPGSEHDAGSSAQEKELVEAVDALGFKATLVEARGHPSQTAEG